MGRPKKRARQDDDLPAPSTTKTRPRQNVQIGSQNLMGDADLTNYDAFEGAFTPGGNLQPWLRSNVDWTNGNENDGNGFDGAASSSGVPTVPALTPDDSSTQSPPTMNFSSEFRSQSNSHSHEHCPPTLLDPTVAGSGDGPAMPSGILPKCACLSTMYLTLNTLQTLSEKQDEWFPYALHPLREATQTASQVLDCEECPKRFITAVQNTHLLGTLLMSISERYGRVLDSITAESERAEAANEKKKFLLSDLNHPTSHLHTGGLGCAASFSVNLSPQEWRSMCRKVVRAEVHGPEDGNECCVYLMGVFKQMEDRQDRWHSQRVPKDFPRDCKGAALGRESLKKEDHLCLKLVGFAKKLVEGFDWS